VELEGFLEFKKKISGQPGNWPESLRGERVLAETSVRIVHFLRIQNRLALKIPQDERSEIEQMQPLFSTAPRASM
jgi:hypothetical protein